MVIVGVTRLQFQKHIVTNPAILSLEHSQVQRLLIIQCVIPIMIVTQFHQ